MSSVSVLLPLANPQEVTMIASALWVEVIRKAASLGTKAARSLADTYRERVLALSHGAPDEAAPQAQASAALDYSSRTGVPFASRTAEQIRAWLTGLEIEPPGVEDIRASTRLAKSGTAKPPVSPFAS